MHIFEAVLNVTPYQPWDMVQRPQSTKKAPVAHMLHTWPLVHILS